MRGPGIPDYRGPSGLWRNDPDHEKLVTIDYYLADPDIRRRSWQFRRDSPARTAAPNAAHLALVELERADLGVGSAFTMTSRAPDLTARPASEAAGCTCKEVPMRTTTSPPS